MRLPNNKRPLTFPTRRALWIGPAALLAAIMVVAGTANRATSEDAAPPPPVTPEAATFFESKIRPVLANNCYGCHGKDVQFAGLRVDSRSALLKGGDSGAKTLLPGDPDKSLLIEVIRHTGKIKMPQGSKLKDSEIADLTAWVKMGAPWPGAKGAAGTEAAAANGEMLTPEQRKFWSLQPVKKPTPPKVKNTAWAKSPIDRFVLAKLEAKGIVPAPPADKRTLIRRATYDLTGLPPTPKEVEAFVADKSPDAFRKVVDRLLASPRYGERWARHWLDVARYADTKGYVFTEDRNYPNAYTYRDWVINAFNRDLPYDQFIIQQLAADRWPTVAEDPRPLAALGFLTVGRRFLNNPHDIADDRIDVTMRGFQGMTVACARCHDHKFDPIPIKDYYSLYGVFANSVETSPPISPKHISQPYMEHEAKIQAAEKERVDTIRAQTAKLRERLKNGEALPDPVKDGLQKVRENDLPEGGNLAKIEPAFEQAARERLPVVRQTLETLRKSYPPKPEFAMALADKPDPSNPRVFKRGNPGTPGDEVPRRFLLAVSAHAKERAVWKEGSGRLELARAIASKENPLTARVMVNRAWLHHFGTGIVRTPSDFGKQGEKPTHPELLDWLAASFMDNGWSMKKLHRMMLLSATYQQSSAFSPKSFAADPENRLVWRMNRRRLDLEQMRDTALHAAGKLDTSKVGGQSVELWQAPFTNRRTVYGRIERQNLPGIFKTFDFATPDSSSPQRFYTSVPQQALFLMNSPFLAEQARALANRSDIKAMRDDAARVRYLYSLLFNRMPTADEATLALRYLKAPEPPQAATEANTPVWRYGYGQFDAGSGRVTAFTPLPHYNAQDRRWQGGPAFPDPKLQFVTLTATGGHTGSDAAHAAIRRWVAPRDGVVTIAGTIGHGHVGDGGDGVEARIVSSRDGVLGTWVAEKSKAETPVARVTVKKGDTIDFVVSPRANPNFDSFTWAPEVKLLDGAVTWSANAQFSGPSEQFKPMSRWERYAQALLLTNEFMFVD